MNKIFNKLYSFRIYERTFLEVFGTWTFGSGPNQSLFLWGDKEITQEDMFLFFRDAKIPTLRKIFGPQKVKLFQKLLRKLLRERRHDFNSEKMDLLKKKE